MTHSEPGTPAPTYAGHVRNGVVVLDSAADLAEGQPVRVQPVGPAAAAGQERTSRVQELTRLFDEWTAEDAALSDADADALATALASSGRVGFRAADLK